MHRCAQSSGRIGPVTEDRYHRLKAGHFTRTDVTQVLAIPIISISNDLDSPSPIIIYTPEYSNGIPSKWNKDVPFPTQFHLIHEIKVLKNSHVNGLDSFLVAGREGIVYFWYDVNGEWNSNVVGYGVERAEGNPYWGSGSVDVGRVGDDPIGFIAATEVSSDETRSFCRLKVIIPCTGFPRERSFSLRQVLVRSQGSRLPQGRCLVDEVDLETGVRTSQRQAYRHYSSRRMRRHYWLGQGLLRDCMHR